MKKSKKQFRCDGTDTPKVKFTPPEEETVKEISKKQAVKVAKREAKHLIKIFKKNQEAADNQLFESIVMRLNHDMQVIINKVMSEHLNMYHSDQLKKPADDDKKSVSPLFSSTVLIPTPNGDKFVTELKPGDLVYGPRGKYLVINATGGYESPSKEPIDVKVDDDNVTSEEHDKYEKDDESDHYEF